MIIIKIAQITDRISTSPSQSSSHCAAHTLETIFELASTPAFLSHRMWLSDVYLENYACHHDAQLEEHHFSKHPLKAGGL